MDKSEIKELREKFDRANQGHVFHYWDVLNTAQQEHLLAQVQRIDPRYINTLYSRALDAQITSPLSPGAADAVGEDSEELSPPPAQNLVPGPASDAWAALGLDAIRAGSVAVLLLAGGQGTRLGSFAPKGCYNVDLPSQKSLFQLQAERILSLGNQAGHPIRWYIMTSGPTREATERFFRDASFFGLDSANVVFFEQGTLPCISNEGKIFMAAPDSVALAPDGNGGIYAALNAPLDGSAPTAGSTKASVLSDMKAHGVKHIHTYCVDNVLVRTADPAFMGYAIQNNAWCGSKVVTKTDPKESVGVLAMRGGKWMVVEYSEIPEDVSAQKDETDPSKLKYRAANIVNHYYSINFLENINAYTSRMAPHIARKKISHIPITTEPVPTDQDPTQVKQVIPTTVNGIKLEFFIFDVLPFLAPEQHVLLEVPRENEFSPLKNAPGTGCFDPSTSRAALLDLHKRWIEKAGGTVDGEVEISPLVSYGGEGLENFKGQIVSGHVEKQS